MSIESTFMEPSLPTLYSSTFHNAAGHQRPTPLTYTERRTCDTFHPNEVEKNEGLEFTDVKQSIWDFIPVRYALGPRDIEQYCVPRNFPSRLRDIGLLPPEFVLNKMSFGYIIKNRETKELCSIYGEPLFVNRIYSYHTDFIYEKVNNF